MRETNLSHLFRELHEDWRLHNASGSPRAFFAVATWRVGRYCQGIRTTPVRWTTGKVYNVANFFSEAFTGVYLERSTQVGERLHLVHAGHINIHPDAVIGDRVGIMHGVTIGTNMGPGVPTIGNDVFIGANASILGGVKIGDNARIAANSLVMSNVPAGGFAIGVPAKIVKVPTQVQPATPDKNTVAAATAPPETKTSANGGAS